MRLFAHNLGTAVLIGLLCACATTAGGHAFREAPAPRAGLTNVYIYRFNAAPQANKVSIVIDGTEVFAPYEHRYTVVPLAPGTHSMRADWKWHASGIDLDFEFQVPADEPLYIRISGSNYYDAATASAIHSNEASAVSAEVAQAELKACCTYVAPVIPGAPTE